MAIKEYSTFPKAPALLESSHHCLMSYSKHSLGREVLPPSQPRRDAVGVFYNRSQLDCLQLSPNSILIGL